MVRTKQVDKGRPNMAAGTKKSPEGSPKPLIALMAASPFLSGLFYEWSSCLAGFYLLCCLMYYRRKNGCLRIPRSSALLTAAVIAAAYGLTALWGVDHGMALIGFAKFLPLPLFALAAAQLDWDGRRSLLDVLPWVGAAMTVLSAALSLIPGLSGFFLVNRRLAGFFQYPNTFALYLLLGAAVLAADRRRRAGDAACLLVLLLGIILSGSRTVLVLLLIGAAVFLFRLRNRKLRLAFAGLLAVTVLVAGAFLLASGRLAAFIERYLTAPLSSSAFLGRLLYAQDALPVILTHPFGLGYLGYSFTQGSFQTGVYSLQNIHNELLQLLLDVGWIPTALLIFAWVQGFRRGDSLRRALLLLIFAHCLFDFDLQFLALDFVLLSALDLGGREGWTVKGAAVCAPGVLLGCVCLYFCVASGLYYAGEYRLCTAVDPAYTRAWIALLPEAEEVEEMDRIAGHIITLNRSVSLAWSAKARAAYAEGDFGAVIDCKERAISLARYAREEYLDYFDMLYIGIQLYKKDHDEQSAEICRQRLLAIPDSMAEVLDGTSALGWRIVDKPDLTLPEQYQEIIMQLDGG